MLRSKVMSLSRSNTISISIDTFENKGENKLENSELKRDLQLKQLIKRIDKAIDHINYYLIFDFDDNRTTCDKKKYIYGCNFLFLGCAIFGLAYLIHAIVESSIEDIVIASLILLAAAVMIYVRKSVNEEKEKKNGTQLILSALAQFHEDEKNFIEQLVHDLHIDLYDLNINNLLDTFKTQKTQLKHQLDGESKMLAFLSGEKGNDAKDTPIQKDFFKNPIYSKNVLPIIFKMAGFLDLSQADKNENSEANKILLESKL